MALLRTELKPSMVQFSWYVKSQSIFGFKFAEQVVTYSQTEPMQIHMHSHSKTHEETFNASNLLPSIIQISFLKHLPETNFNISHRTTH